MAAATKLPVITEDSSGLIRSDLYSLEALQDFRISARASLSCKNVPSLIPVLAALLQRSVTRQTAKFSSVNDKLAKFSGSRVPAISLEQYLERIFKYANCSPSCFVVAYVYLDRLLNNNRSTVISECNVHRLVITSVLVSAKFLDDLHYDNAYFAQIGGISIQEMNMLEMEFLFLLNFRLQVTPTIFESYCDHLEREATLGSLQRTLESISSIKQTCTRTLSNVQDKNPTSLSKTSSIKSIKQTCTRTLSNVQDKNPTSLSKTSSINTRRSASRIMRCADGS